MMVVAARCISIDNILAIDESVIVLFSTSEEFSFVLLTIFAN
jgi:hypothetical protein